MPNDKAVISPKLVALCKWELIDELNKQLDDGVSPNALVGWIKSKGFDISLPLVYKYAALRDRAIKEQVAVESLIGVIKPQPMPMNAPSNVHAVNKLRNELTALDTLIQRGYDSLNQMQDIAVPPRLMMEAIKLKNDLTGGTHAFLTPYGLEEYRELEMGRCNALMEALIPFIPEETKEQALDAITQAEDAYYQGTPYYGDYLRSQNIPEAEIEQRLQAIAKREPIVTQSEE